MALFVSTQSRRDGPLSASISKPLLSNKIEGKNRTFGTTLSQGMMINP